MNKRSQLVLIALRSETWGRHKRLYFKSHYLSPDRFLQSHEATGWFKGLKPQKRVSVLSNPRTRGCLSLYSCLFSHSLTRRGGQRFTCTSSFHPYCKATKEGGVFIYPSVFYQLNLRYRSRSESYFLIHCALSSLVYARPFLMLGN